MFDGNGKKLTRTVELAWEAFGLFPVHIHLGQREVGKLLTVALGRRFEILKTADKLAVSALQGFLRIDAGEAGEIDQRKK